MSTGPAPSSPRPRTPRTRGTNVKQTSKTRLSSPTTQPDRQTSSKQAKQDPHHPLHNQTDKRQANKQNKTLITDYTTRQQKKSGGSDSQQMTPPARGRSPRRQNRAHSTLDDSLKHRRSPTGDTPPTDRQTSTSPRGGPAIG